MLFTFCEDGALPKMTVCASFRTAREFEISFGHRAFDILFDETLTDDVVFVSSDLYKELKEFIEAEDQSESRSA